VSGKWLYPADTPVTIARKVAVSYRTHLRAANPTACGRVDDAMRGFGQLWIVSSVVTTDADSMVTTADAAELAGVTVETVRQWRKRGYLDHDGQRQYLQVRGLDDHDWPMFNAGEVLAIVAATRSRRKAA
jgi:hypothetical protein